MTWLLIGVLTWVALAVPLALVLGRAIRVADKVHDAAASEAVEPNFVATDVAPGDVALGDVPEEPWTGPSTVPFAPSRLPWGGERTSSRPLPPIVRHPVKPVERDPGARDSGLT